MIDMWDEKRGAIMQANAHRLGLVEHGPPEPCTAFGDVVQKWMASPPSKVETLTGGS